MRRAKHGLRTDSAASSVARLGRRILASVLRPPEGRPGHSAIRGHSGAALYYIRETSLSLIPLAVSALALCGCRFAAPHAPTSQPAPAAGSAELMGYVAEQPLVTAETGYRVIHALWKGDAFAGDFDALAAALAAGRVIDGSWRLKPDACLDRATVGYMVCRAVGIRSGINWMLTGLGRYAWRELQYRNIAGPGSESSLISGGEFLGVVGRADDFLTIQRAGELRRAELGERPK